jgi:hypothetical protein
MVAAAYDKEVYGDYMPAECLCIIVGQSAAAICTTVCTTVCATICAVELVNQQCWGSSVGVLMLMVVSNLQ